MARAARKMAEKAGFEIENLVDLLVKNPEDRGLFLKQAVTDSKQAYLQKALELHAGNQSRAAEVLGIHRNGPARRIKTMSAER
jgi:transcriptional regulator with PAS, ATPase and Fis domain